MRNTKKRVNIISTRQSIKPFRKIRKEVLRYQTIVTRLCYGESGYSTLFFASRKDYTNTHTFLCQSLFFLTVIIKMSTLNSTFFHVFIVLPFCTIRSLFYCIFSLLGSAIVRLPLLPTSHTPYFRSYASCFTSSSNSSPAE